MLEESASDVNVNVYPWRSDNDNYRRSKSVETGHRYVVYNNTTKYIIVIIITFDHSLLGTIVATVTTITTSNKQTEQIRRA